MRHAVEQGPGLTKGAAHEGKQEIKAVPRLVETVKTLYLIVYFGLILLPWGALNLLFAFRIASRPPQWLSSLGFFAGIPLAIAGLIWLDRQEKLNKKKRK